MGEATKSSMSETSNIAEIARTVAKDIFSVFGWKTVGPKDHDFDCTLAEKHAKRTHPSDIVFWYEDPYANQKVFLNTDLKSWKKDTFSKPKIRGEIASLCQAVECANVSSQWAQLFADSTSTFQVHGLLFLFNHDNALEADVSRMLADYEPDSFSLPRNYRVFVLTPETILYLASVANDIRASCGGGLLPGLEKFKFYYPDLVEVRPKSNERTVATAEVLCGPWQVLRFHTPQSSKAQIGYFVYYRGKGASEDEFKYLIDFFFRYQLLGDNEMISVRMPFAEDRAKAVFERAKDSYAADFYSMPEFRDRLNRITFERIQRISLSLSPTDEAIENG